MTDIFKPMQPCNADLDLIRFPAIAQKKWDGMKLIIRNSGGALEILGRSMKPVKNQWLIDQLTQALKPLCNQVIGFGGEIQGRESLEGSDGILSAHYRELPFILHIFDDFTQPESPYSARRDIGAAKVAQLSDYRIRFVDSVTVESMDDLLNLHKINAGNKSLDGTIIRDLEAAYKNGKSTTRSGQIVKIKDFQDAEAQIIGFTELMHNDNAALTNPLGRTERSTAKARMTPGNVLGALVCVYEGQTFKVGSGFDATQRAALWAQRESLTGQTIKFSYQRITKHNTPLLPVFIAFRDLIDIEQLPA